MVVWDKGMTGRKLLPQGSEKFEVAIGEKEVFKLAQGKVAHFVLSFPFDYKDQTQIFHVLNS